MNNSFDALTKREYLLTNGLGGYISSTFCGANTRRYHGLLVASFNPPTERKVVVSKVEETVIVQNDEFELASNQYPRVAHPSGFQFIQSIKATSHQVEWHYRVNGHVIVKKIRSVAGRNTTVLSYCNQSKMPVAIHVRPLLVWRDFHALFSEQPYYNFFLNAIDERTLEVFAHYDAPPLYMITNKGKWSLTKQWYKNFEYIREKERGFAYHEDAMQVGECQALLYPCEQVELVFTIEKREEAVNEMIRTQEPMRAHKNSFIQDLVKSANQFIVYRQSTQGSSIIAGYPWFSDWGRDTMIAMRGLTISTAQQTVSKSILQSFLSSIRDGMLPNRFPDYAGDTVEYNTMDAALWLFVAVYEYWLRFKDDDFVKQNFSVLGTIIQKHIDGTHYHIKVDDDGLLKGGEPGVQLTWMDAIVGNYVVTPRMGKPIEINLLWYNALKIMERFCEALQIENLPNSTKHLAQFEKSCSKFYNQQGYVADVLLEQDEQDNRIRPNMIYALSLPFSPVDAQTKKKILDIVTATLYTPYGLRSLAPDDVDFKPTYEGDAAQRDSAYHQGTVWTFLWGEWALAYLTMLGFSKKACQEIWKKSKELQHQFYHEGCSHALAEIYDGLHPTFGKGCVHQAWSIGNMLLVFLHPDFKTEVMND